MAQATKVLPARPNLSYLRKLAKKQLRAMRQRGESSSRLADAQLAVAREHGFASWRKLKAHVETSATAGNLLGESSASPSPERIAAFLDAAVPRPEEDHRGGSLETAMAMLAETPELADADIYTAAIVGNHRRLAELLSNDEKLANRPGSARNWPPLCYLTFSRFLRIEKRKRSREFLHAAKVLLDAGADPNSHFIAKWAGEDIVEPALYGASGVANDSALTKLLLDRGAVVANPPDSESLYHVTEFRDHRCLELLLKQKPGREWTSYCMCHMMDREDPEGLKLFLKHGGDPNFLIDRGSVVGLRPLHFAITRNRSARIIRALLEAGADPNLADSRGIHPYSMARRLGHTAAANALLKAGANDDLSPTETILAAIMSGNARRAKQLIAQQPDFVKSLSVHDQMLLPHAAGAGNLKAVRVMLDLGFPIETIGGWGGTALHHAAWTGHLDIVELLLSRGARMDSKQHFGGDVVNTAIHGATHAGHRNGPAIVERLLRSLPADADLKPYIEQATRDEHERIVKLLLRLGVSRLHQTASQRTAGTSRKSQWQPIMDASFNGDVGRAKELLDGGADPNVISGTAHRYRPLHRSIEHKLTIPKHDGHDATVKLLMERGADPKLRATHSQFTALQLAAVGEPRFIPLLLPHFKPLDIHHASVLGEAEVVREQLRADRALASQADGNGWQPLHYCAASVVFRAGLKQTKASAQIAQMLLAAGADPMAAVMWDSKWPLRPLYYACGWSNNPAVAEVLLRAGADPCDNESAFHAADEEHDACLKLIEKYTDPKKLAKECTRALYWQLRYGRVRGLEWLLEHGADPKWKNPETGRTAIDEAIRGKKNPQVVKMLKR